MDDPSADEQPMELYNRFSLDIADIVVSTASQTEELFRVPRVCRPFSSERDPDLSVSVIYGAFPQERLPEQLVFDNGVFWTLSRNEESWVWRYHALDLPSKVTRVGLYSLDYTVGHLYLSDRESLGRNRDFPLTYPLDRFLYTTLLASRYGVMFHACGVDLQDRGLLLVGESGAGKSTLATLWDRDGYATVLNDERIAVREFPGRITMYGTPWHGTAELCSPKQTTPEAIFLLEHGEDNRVRLLSPLEAFRRLVPCTFWPFWSRSGMDRALQVVQNIVQRVPCYALTFRPGPQVVEFLAETVEQPPAEG
jgi:hypothetical protein